MVGYVRVSTQRQADQGESLDEQVDAMRTFGSQNDFTVPEIYSDTASAFGAKSHLKRGDLLGAVRQARALGMPLLVARLDRLARNSQALKLLDVPGLEIFSIADGGRVTKRRLRAAIREAQREAGGLSRSAKASWPKIRKRRGRKGHEGPKDDDKRRGQISNVLRHDRKVKEVADFLRTNPAWQPAGARRLSRHLNETGMLNLVSDAHGIRRPWTKDSLFKILDEARKLLVLEAELDAEEVAASIAVTV